MASRCSIGITVAGRPHLKPHAEPHFRKLGCDQDRRCRASNDSPSWNGGA